MLTSQTTPLNEINTFFGIILIYFRLDLFLEHSWSSCSSKRDVSNINNQQQPIQTKYILFSGNGQLCLCYTKYLQLSY